MKFFLLINFCVILNNFISAKRGPSLIDKLFITSTETNKIKQRNNNLASTKTFELFFFTTQQLKLHKNKEETLTKILLNKPKNNSKSTTNLTTTTKIHLNYLNYNKKKNHLPFVIPFISLQIPLITIESVTTKFLETLTTTKTTTSTKCLYPSNLDMNCWTEENFNPYSPNYFIDCNNSFFSNFFQCLSQTTTSKPVTTLSTPYTTNSAQQSIISYFIPWLPFNSISKFDSITTSTTITTTTIKSTTKKESVEKFYPFPFIPFFAFSTYPTKIVLLSKKTTAKMTKKLKTTSAITLKNKQLKKVKTKITKNNNSLFIKTEKKKKLNTILQKK